MVEENVKGYRIGISYTCTALLLLCSHSPNDVPPEPQRNVSIAAERGVVRPSICTALRHKPAFIATW